MKISNIITSVSLAATLMVGSVQSKDHKEGKVVREGLRLLFQLMVPFPITFANDTLEDLQELGIEVELVDNIPGFSEDTGGAYFFESGKILLNKNIGLGSRQMTDKVAAHEVVHKLRYEAGMWTNHALEEYIACHMTVYAAEMLFDEKYRLKDVNQYFLDTMKVNNLTGWVIDIDIAEIEIEKTKRLFEQLVEGK